MKRDWWFNKFSKWVIDNFDSFQDARNFIGLIFCMLPFMYMYTVLQEYGLHPEFGYMAVFGQVCNIIVRFIFPEVFPKQKDYALGSWILRFWGNCMLAWTFGVFLTEFFAIKLGEKSISIVGVAVGVGFLYEWILKGGIKYVARLTNKGEFYKKE